MNYLYEQEIRYKLLKLLTTEAKLSQREMARRMGLSLGKTNYVLTELANKGIIKIKRFKRIRNAGSKNMPDMKNWSNGFPWSETLWNGCKRSVTVCQSTPVNISRP